MLFVKKSLAKPVCPILLINIAVNKMTEKENTTYGYGYATKGVVILAMSAISRTPAERCPFHSRNRGAISTQQIR